ncbi:MAG: outer membrane lipoprotein-sorting protein [Nitrospirae bacterium]|nr:outer membrane lipoprotein-sorting protein [Magnetococcales bacterium]HAT50047.1 hypothetical protein [Alphaproteobacteria bacterium]
MPDIKIVLKILIVTLCFGLIHKSWAFVDAEGESILLQVDQTMFPEAFVNYFTIENTAPNMKKDSISLFSAQNKTGQSVILIVDPPALLGRSAFWDGKEIWIHTPGELEARKSGLQQSFVGGVFNNMDLMMGPYHTHHRAQLEGEDKDFQYLKLIPKTDGLPYIFMKMKINKHAQVVAELSQYVREDTLFKRIIFEDVKEVSRNSHRPTSMATSSELNPLYRSKWRLGVQKEEHVAPEAFSVEFLPKLGQLLK